MRYFKIKSIFLIFLILGCKSISNEDFNIHDTNYRTGQSILHGQSIISRSCDNKLSILGIYDPITEKESFRITVYIPKKGLFIDPESILINQDQVDYFKYQLDLKSKSRFKKSSFSISSIDSRNLLTQIYDRSVGNHIQINFKDHFNLPHIVKIDKECVKKYLSDFDKEVEISKNILQKRIESRKIELEKIELKVEYDELKDCYIYSMEVPRFFEKLNTLSETYRSVIVANYYPGKNLNILFLNLSLFSNKWYLFHSIYGENGEKLKIYASDRTLKGSNIMNEKLNIILSPQQIINMTENFEKNDILNLKSYGETGEFTFEIYRPILLKFLDSVNNSIKHKEYLHIK